MPNPKSKPRCTVEKCKQEIARLYDCIDVLENHCEITDEDSIELVVFKLYAKYQSVVDVYTFANELRGKVFRTSTEISDLIPKTSIEDKKLEAFVKSLQSSAKKYRSRRE